MGRKLAFAAAIIAALSLFTGGAIAARHYIITSTRQIKPSVLRQFQARLAHANVTGPTAYMCAAGTDTTGSCEVGASDARCPGKSIVTGGGVDGGAEPPVDGSIGYSEADADGHGWHVIMANNAAIESTVSATADCLGVAGRLPAAVPASTSSAVQAQIASELAHARAAVRR
jgi:hypothetical protein